MPRINIYETEPQAFVSFDSTENSVLIPLYTLAKNKEDYNVMIPEKFTSVSAFRGKYNPDNVAKYLINSTDTEGVLDASYAMICELLNIGLPVVVMPILLAESSEMGSEFSKYGVFESKESLIEDLNERISSNNLYKIFSNKNLYNIKFITSGAYPNLFFGEDSEKQVTTSGAYSVMLNAAAERGDALALVEFEDLDENSLLSKLSTNIFDDRTGKFGCATYPAGLYTCPAAGTSKAVEMPGAFGYLMAFGNSVASNANWIAAAGVVRGYIPRLIKLNHSVGESTMHLLQGDDQSQSVSCFVNAIMEVGAYGTRLWGNRVLYKDSNATVLPYSAFLNVRMLICDIKKQLYHSALRITFEPNDDIAWGNFKKLNNTLLDKMKSGRGIQWYRWSKVVTDQRATIKAILTIKPIEAVEYFDLTVALSDDDELIVTEEA